MDTTPTLYLIPSFLSEEATETIPVYILKAVKQCQVFFVENERTARRFLKKMSQEIIIDSYEWFTIDKHPNEALEVRQNFMRKLSEGKTIGLLSEAGCPGIADPGQQLVALAHAQQAIVKPLVGPSAVLLALMGSGLNGQQFQFLGYLPIDQAAKSKAINQLEAESKKKNCTQVFIETPYRNNHLLETLIKVCLPSTSLCIAVNLTAPNESIHTKTIAEWKKNLPDLHKQPTIFCLLS